VDYSLACIDSKGKAFEIMFGSHPLGLFDDGALKRFCCKLLASMEGL
jgi:hypothetical protein